MFEYIQFLFASLTHYITDTFNNPAITQKITNALAYVRDYAWGTPTATLLIGTGIIITILTKGIQFRGFWHGIMIVAGKGKYSSSKKKSDGEISNFQALATALSATIGLGSIAGVAIAITIGGPGALFWMILSGVIGMAIKYAECTLAVMYRHIDKDGVIHGGPMHYIELGLGKKWKPLALFFAFSCFMATLGTGNMFQTNQIASVLNQNFDVPNWITGVTLTIMTLVVIIGGIKRIGTVASWLVPIMGVIYIIGASIVVFNHFDKIPALISLVIHDAFSGTAAIGGFAGIGVREAMIQGLRRAAFSNEAGLGSAPIAHSAANTSEPVKQGLVSLLEPFVTTIVVCSLTAIVILVSDTYIVGEANLGGAALTSRAFDSVIPGFGHIFIPIAVFLFGYSTLLSWYYYGNQAILLYIWRKSHTPL